MKHARFCAAALAALVSLNQSALAQTTVVPLWPELAKAAATKHAPSTRPATTSTARTADLMEDRGTPEYPDRSVSNIVNPTLTVYLPPKAINTGAALVICPGGGYRILAFDKEGHAVARWLNSIGVAGIVLKYRMPDVKATGDGTPLPLQDAHRAIRMVRASAKGWGIDPKRVGILGFSAGGHLASSALTHVEGAGGDAADAIERQSDRPDFGVLVYPVVTMDEKLAHAGSRTNLLGAEPKPEMLKKYSNELQVSADTPPTFLVHAKDDRVKVENSILFYEALKKNNVPAELVLFEKGGHGFGLGVNGGEPATWPGKCEAWMRSRGLLGSAGAESGSK